jgi:hypothetical protein
VSFVSRRISDALIARLRRDYAALLMAGGTLPEHGRAWVEARERVLGEHLGDEDFRWTVVSEQGWSNVGGVAPMLLVANAPKIYFTRLDDGRCCVGVVPPPRSTP